MPVRKLDIAQGAPDILQPFTTWNTLDSRIDY
jgi:guanine deaminase